MKGNGKNWEILAPAGSVEQLVAAVHSGCDSVYLGVDNFNARMKAPNFDAQNIGRWIDFCHFFGVKVYVAVNTSVKNDEIFAAKQVIYCAYKNDADGVIVTDLSLMRYAASLPKPFEVVASTQLNIHDGLGADFAKKIGATTVVCARECSLDEIKEISAAGVTAECFVHGALCVCQSGQCLFSSMVGGNSGNRGLCAQPCRKLYYASEGRFTGGGYLLSASDICSLDTAKSMVDAGVSVFKIEGRNRRAEYAAVTSAVYSRLFESEFRYDGDDRTELLETFNRGDLPQNYYLCENNGNIIYPYAQNHIGRRVGTVSGNCILCEVAVEKGDGLKVFDGNREVCGALATEDGERGKRIKAEFSDRVKDGFAVCRTTSVAQSKEVLSARRMRNVSVKFVALAGSKANLTLQSGDTRACVESDFIVQKAQKLPLSDGELREQLCKIGDLCYTITDIAVETDGVFIAKSQVNALRRQAFEILSNKIIEDYNCKFEVRKEVCEPTRTESSSTQTTKMQPKNCLAVICRTAAEVKAACNKADYVIFKPENLTREILCEVGNIRCFLDLPSLCDCQYIKRILPEHVGIVCHNVGQVEFARREKICYIAGAGLNIFNDEMSREFADADTFVYSQELTLKEIADFENKDGIVFVDGELILMKVTHCPYKLNFGCDCAHCKADKKLEYTDEQGNKFALKRRKDRRCTFELINGKKLSVANKLFAGGRYLVDFDEVIIQHYLNFNRGVDDGYRETSPYTKGRLFNKIN